jgi:hypothetical protein
MSTKKSSRRVDGANPFSKKAMLKKSVWTASEYKAYTGKESDLQNQVERYLDTVHTDYIRIPDILYKIIFSDQYRVYHKGTKQDVTARVRGAISAHIKGIPDLVVMEPFLMIRRPPRSTLELKVKNRKASKAQQTKFKNIPLIVEQSFEGATAFCRRLKEYAAALSRELRRSEQ